VAGEPIEVGNESFEVFDEDDVVEVGINMLPTKKTEDLFALRVNGDSMIDAMVNDGDIVIMRQQETAQNGDMVAVWIESNGTTTLKHFYRDGAQIRLQPANPTMEPIYVPADDVRVQGKVMMVLRQTP
jgi:repressor LexA